MTEIVDFLKLALRTEFGSVGGAINFAIVGVLGLLAAGMAAAELLRFLSQALDRAMHFIEKCLEFISDLRGGTFEASPKPLPYEVEAGGIQVKLVVTVGIFFIACMLALGGARYEPTDPGKKGDGGTAGVVRVPAGSLLR